MFLIVINVIIIIGSHLHRQFTIQYLHNQSNVSSHDGATQLFFNKKNHFYRGLRKQLHAKKLHNMAEPGRA
jgi:hypothetical protein